MLIRLRVLVDFFPERYRIGVAVRVVEPDALEFAAVVERIGRLADPAPLRRPLRPFTFAAGVIAFIRHVEGDFLDVLVFHAVDGKDLDHGVVFGVVAVDVGAVAQVDVALGDDDDGGIRQRHMKVIGVHAQGQGVDIDGGAHA